MVVDALRQREPDAAVVELLHLRTTARRRLDYFHFDDLNKKLFINITCSCSCFLGTSCHIDLQLNICVSCVANDE